MRRDDVRCVDNEAIIWMCVRNGADVNARDEGGSTPLHTAAMSGALRSIRVLLDAGADINARTFPQAGCATPLMGAATGGGKGFLDCVELLLERKADVHARSILGATAATSAFGVGAMNIVAALRKAGATR